MVALAPVLTAAEVLDLNTSATGSFGTLDFKLSLEDVNGRPMSWWHDIPWKPADKPMEFYMNCELPKYSCQKMEAFHGEPHNPLKQDAASYRNERRARIYDLGVTYYSYGEIPQTWESMYDVDRYQTLTPILA